MKFCEVTLSLVKISDPADHGKDRQSIGPNFCCTSNKMLIWNIKQSKQVCQIFRRNLSCTSTPTEQLDAGKKIAFYCFSVNENIL